MISNRLNTLFGGDKQLVQKFIDLFKEEVPIQLNEMKSAMAQSDWEEVQNTAHKLKSQLLDL